MEDYEPADTCWMITDSKKDGWVDCDESSLDVKTQSQLDPETKKLQEIQQLRKSALPNLVQELLETFKQTNSMLETVTQKESSGRYIIISTQA